MVLWSHAYPESRSVFILKKSYVIFSLNVETGIYNKAIYYYLFFGMFLLAITYVKQQLLIKGILEHLKKIKYMHVFLLLNFVDFV